MLVVSGTTSTVSARGCRFRSSATQRLPAAVPCPADRYVPEQTRFDRGQGGAPRRSLSSVLRGKLAHCKIAPFFEFLRLLIREARIICLNCLAQRLTFLFPQSILNHFIQNGRDRYATPLYSTRSPETQSIHVTTYNSSSFWSCGSRARLSDSQSYLEYYLKSYHGRPQKSRGPFRSRGFQHFN